MSFVKIFDTEGDQKQPKLFQELKLQLKNNQPPQKQDVIIHRIVDLTLQSRPLCRLYQGRILDGIHQKLYTKIRDLLRVEIRRILNKESSIQTLTLETLNQFQLTFFQDSLNDQTLKELALYAQKQSCRSIKNHCLGELVKAIEISRRLCRPHRAKFNFHFYPHIYEEAVVETMTYICTNIDKYDPNRSSGKFMSWVNFKLDKVVLDCRKKFDLSSSFDFLPVPDFNMIPYQPRAISSGEKLYNYIQEDTDKKFQKTYLPSNPEINFQQVAIERLSGYTWKEIAEHLGSNSSALSAFYERSCNKFKELLDQEVDP